MATISIIDALWFQILSIMCDDASNNGTMILELSNLVPTFPSESNLTRCFNHILSLIGKTAIHVFDVLQVDKDEELDNATAELLDLAKNINIEELKAQAVQSDGNGDGDGDGGRWTARTDGSMSALSYQMLSVRN